MINGIVVVATGLNANGRREVLAMRVATSETGPAWNTFFADVVARGLREVRLVTSDAHQGLVETIAATLPGASWQRCRTHYATNLMSVTPKNRWPALKAMPHSGHDQTDADAGHTRFDRLLDYLRAEAIRRVRPPRHPPAWLCQVTLYDLVVTSRLQILQKTPLSIIDMLSHCGSRLFFYPCPNPI